MSIIPSHSIVKTVPQEKPIDLPGTIECVTCFFNPLNREERVNNFFIFYEHLAKQGITPYVIELGISPQKWVLHDIVNQSHLVQISDAVVLWQKECLLNLLIAQLPPECDKVCWIDADILFKNPDWLSITAGLLNYHKIVQPFSYIANLPRGLDFIPDELDIESFPIRHGDCARVFSYIMGILELDKTDGHPGFVWAARRNLLDKYGLYDECIAGGGDWLISRAATWRHYSPQLIERYSRYQIASYVKWAQPFCDDINYSYTYIPNTAYHLYHGKIGNRGYKNRLEMMKQYEYDPRTDIVKRDNGMWGLTLDGKKLSENIHEYFLSREESS